MTRALALAAAQRLHHRVGTRLNGAVIALVVATVTFALGYDMWHFSEPPKATILFACGGVLLLFFLMGICIVGCAAFFISAGLWQLFTGRKVL